MRLLLIVLNILDDGEGVDSLHGRFFLRRRSSRISAAVRGRPAGRREEGGKLVADASFRCGGREAAKGAAVGARGDGVTFGKGAIDVDGGSWLAGVA